MAYRRTTFRLSLAVLRQKVHEERRIAASPSNAYWRKEIRVSCMRKEVHEERSFDKTSENTREPEKEKFYE